MRQSETAATDIRHSLGMRHWLATSKQGEGGCFVILLYALLTHEARIIHEGRLSP